MTTSFDNLTNKRISSKIGKNGATNRFSFTIHRSDSELVWPFFESLQLTIQNKMFHFQLFAQFLSFEGF